MKIAERLAIATITAAVTPFGCTVSTQRGGKHLLLTITAPDGRWHKKPLSGTPGADNGAVVNHSRQAAHRVLREWGLLPSAPVHRCATAHRHHNTAPERAITLRREPIRKHPSRDPWACLAGLLEPAP